MMLYDKEKRRLGKLGWLLLLLSPYALLAVLLVVNTLFLRGDAHCALPTLLEQDMWVLPSVVGSWLFYVMAIPIGEIILAPIVFVLSGAYLSIKSIFKPEMRAAAWRRVFLGLPLIIMIVGLLIAAGMWWMTAHIGDYQAQDLAQVLIYIELVVTGFAALGVMVWLLVAGILEKRNKSEAVRKRGTRTIVSAVLHFFLLPFVFGSLIVATGTESSVYYEASVQKASYATTAGVAGIRAVPENFSYDADTIGFAVGGAKDADNFRENIDNCYLPIPSDITYEGLFFDYQFDTENKTACSALFCPQYEAAVLPDPFSKQDEYFLSVGLGSGLAIEDFARPPLDVVIVLDVSGSMSSPFDRYYYDQFRIPGGTLEDLNDWNKSKMEIAKEAVNAMVDHLQPADRFGMVLFDHNATRFIPFRQISDSGYKDIQRQVDALQSDGGTNMEAGLTLGTEVMESLPRIVGEDRERRIIFLTDAQPNTGALQENALYTIGKENAEKGIHTTFIGIGVDFNTRLIESLTKEIRGANYFAVHSSSDFERRLDTEFEYLIAPLLYDLKLTIEGGDYEIREVYGSPEANKATGDVLHVSSLFPSPTTTEEGSRGGVILAHIRQVVNTGSPTKVVASYVDRQGRRHSEQQTVTWSGEAKTDPSANIRKAALLTRFVNIMQNWIIDENLRQGPHDKTIYVPIQPTVFYHDGLVIPEERYHDHYRRSGNNYGFVQAQLSEWERLSRPLVVSKDYREVFEDFMDYFKEEYRSLNERNLLKRELEILDNLTNSPKP